MLLANKPARVGSQIDSSADRPVRRYPKRDEMNRPPRVAVVRKGADPDQVGMGPADGIRAHAGRQMPRYARRLAGIAGVLPVGVPTRADVEDKGQVHRPAGGYVDALCDEPSGDVLG